MKIRKPTYSEFQGCFSREKSDKFHVRCPFYCDKWNILEFLLPNIWNTFEYIPVKICTGLDVGYDPKIMVILLSLNESKQYLISDSWMPHSSWHLSFTELRLFRKHEGFLFLCHQLPLNVPCDRCVLFFTLECWVYVTLFLLLFYEIPLTKKSIY